MGAFDQAARYAYRAEPESVTRRLLRNVSEPLAFRELMDTRTTPLPGERDRTADTVAALDDQAHPEQPWLLVVEFQAQHDPDKLDVSLVTAARMRADYRHGVDRQGKYKVLVGLVYLQGQCPESLLDMTVSGGAGTRHQPLVWNVAEDDAAAVLAEMAAGTLTWGLLFWIPLMKNGGDPGIIAEWRRLAAGVSSSRFRADLGRIALIFAEMAGCFAAWERALEDWDMTESQVVNRWIEQAREERDLENARAYVLRALQRRFPGPLPAQVTDTLGMQPSLRLLQDWFDAAMTVNSVEEFIAILRQ
jgi:hypothetical protein